MKLRLIFFVFAAFSAFLPETITAESSIPVWDGPKDLLYFAGRYLGDRAAGDFNGDGLVDLAVLIAQDDNEAFTTNSPVHILLNTGHGFKDATSKIIKGKSPMAYRPSQRSLILDDFNGDGRLDIFIGDECDGCPPRSIVAHDVLLLSTSRGKLKDASSTLPPVEPTLGGPSVLAVGDIDGDGDLDLFIGEYIEPIRFWINDGTGHFTADFDRLPPEAMIDFDGYTYPHGNAFSGAYLIDVNRDGYLDLLLGRSYTWNKSLILLNDGTGHFYNLTDAIKTKGLATGGFWPYDVNGDGSPDLITISDNSTNNCHDCWRFDVFINNTNGRFKNVTKKLVKSPAVKRGLNGGSYSSLYELNGDGIPDFYTFLSQTNGKFVQLPFNALPWFTQHDTFYPIDVDGDGGHDIIGSDIGNDSVTYLYRDIGPVIRPGIPINVRATHGRYTGEVRICWPYVWSATSYEVWRSEGGAATRKLIGTTKKMYFRDTSAVSGSQYDYFIRPRNTGGIGEYSDPATGSAK